MFVNPDFSDLLSVFNDNHVKYLVIGGYAYVLYAEPRYTKDLDLWVSTDAENAIAVYTALKSLGAPLDGLTEADFSEDGYCYQVGLPPLRVDILMGIRGESFDSAWERRNEVDMGGLVVPFISREDLIEVKQASRRPQDLFDADLLERAGADPEPPQG
jgi:hypothetical protein